MSQKVTTEVQQTYPHKRVYLPDSGPKGVGRLPDGLAPPTRPVSKGVTGSTKTRTIERPAQGHTDLESALPPGSPESRTATTQKGYTR